MCNSIVDVSEEFQYHVIKMINVSSTKVAIFSPIHFIFSYFFGDLDKSFSLGIAHASMALRSLNHDFIVHEALVLVLTFIILEKLFNRFSLEKTYIQVTNEVSALFLFVDKHQDLLCN